MPNKALQQNRGDVLRYGESIGCDLLKAAVRSREAQSQSQSRLWLTRIGGAKSVGGIAVRVAVLPPANHLTRRLTTLFLLL
jgi:hypothetical protein